MSADIRNSNSYLPTKEGDSYSYEPSNSPFMTTRATEDFSNSPIAGKQMSMEHATPLESNLDNQAPVFKEKFFEDEITTTTTTYNDLNPAPVSSPVDWTDSDPNKLVLGGEKTQVFEQTMIPEYHHGANVNDPKFDENFDTTTTSYTRDSFYDSNNSSSSRPLLAESSSILEAPHTETEAHLNTEGRPVTETTVVGTGLTSSTTSLPSSGITLPASVTTLPSNTTSTTEVTSYTATTEGLTPGEEVIQTTNSLESSPLLGRPVAESLETTETLSDTKGRTVKETTKETIAKPNEVTETFTEKTIERDPLGGIEKETTVESSTKTLGETRGINSSTEKIGYDDYYDEDTVHKVSSTENPTHYNHGEPHKPSQMTKIKGAIKEKFGHLTKNKRMEEEGKILEAQFQRQKNDYDAYLHTSGKSKH